MKHLAIDLGASSGKIFVGGVENSKFSIEEVHRFDDYLIKKEDCLVWDIEKIINNIYEGINKANKKFDDISSIGVDSWAVDFVLIDKEGKLIGDPVSYREERTLAVVDEVKSIFGDYGLYEKTGIQYQSFNTIYQLYYLKKYQPDLLEKADRFLMIPDYINYVLTGKKYNEYTNASSTQLLDPVKRNWDYDLIEKLGLPKKIFGQILQAPDPIGPIKNDNIKTEKEINLIAVASHDTASAVVTVPEGEENLFLSSGTWSLLGDLIDRPLINKKAFDENYTNEGGINNTIRFLKNINGMWIVQRLRIDLEKKYSFADLDSFVLKSNETATIDLNDPIFLSPPSMKEALISYLEKNNYRGSLEVKDLMKIFYNSLVALYKKSISIIDELTGAKHEALYIIGGGSQAEVLNQMLKANLNLDIFIGPVEGSAIGNLMVQINLEENIGLEEIRKLLKEAKLVKEISHE